MAFDAFSFDLAQSLHAHHIISQIKINIFTKAHFVRVCVIVSVAAHRNEATFDTFRCVRCAGADIPGFAGFFKNIPQLCAFSFVFQIDFKPALLRPARALHSNGDSFDYRVFEPEVFQITHPVSHHMRNNGFGLGAL